MRNFLVLSDIEFEELVADLLAQHLAVPVERFARGADGGIDLRWRLAAGPQLAIGQCKHYCRSTFAQLLSSANDELEKVQKLQPSRYMFITSMDLTPGQKDKIYDIFRAWMRGPEDVWGGGDVDGLLTTHVDVERRHIKLLVSSGAQLFWATHSSIYNRAAALRDRIERSLPRYVVNAGYKAAWKILDAHRVCIIAGGPGIGKTTLANALVADAITRRYEPVEVSEDVDEAWAALADDRPQVFLYDDFLGQLSFQERLHKNEDRRLAEFVSKVSSTKSKLLVMTTREYVLSDARRVYERIDSLDTRMQLVLALKDYGRGDRARILYNHLWHGNLSLDALTSVANGGYREIIDHPAYNPRLIEYGTGPQFDTVSGDYASRLCSLLSNPDKLWRTAFDNHLSEEQRLLAVVMATFPSAVEVSDVATAFLGLSSARGARSTNHAFRDALAALEGSLLSVTRRADCDFVEFVNPGIREFTLGWLFDAPDLLDVAIQSASFFEQVVALFDYGRVRGPRSTPSEDGVRRRTPPALRELSFQVAVRRLFSGPSSARRNGWDDASRRNTWLVPDSWFEDRLMRVLALDYELVAAHADWVPELVHALTVRWEHQQGGKPEAVRAMRKIEAMAAVYGLQPDRVGAARAALDSWLPLVLTETERDWIPYLDRLESELGMDIYDDEELARRFELFAGEELERWSPSPPNMEELTEYAERFRLREVLDTIETRRRMERAADSEARKGVRVPASVDSSGGGESDAELGLMFRRLTSVGVATEE